jgi:hypothetical protein
MSESSHYVWDVESADEAAGKVRVSLVRRYEQRSSKHLLPHTETLDRTVLFSRCFRPLLESVALEHYAARLRLIADHAREGRFGCFVETRSEGGSVEVMLYDRWFDESEIHTEELARRAFDASDERALVASVEFLAELRIWAERRNEERDDAILRERDADRARAQLRSEREAASRELSQILAAHSASAD